MTQNEPRHGGGGWARLPPPHPPGREYRSQLTLLRRLENTSHLFSLVMSQCSHDPVLAAARLAAAEQPQGAAVPAAGGAASARVFLPLGGHQHLV